MFSTVPDALRNRIRSEVRAERPYIVAGARDLPVKLNQNESPFDVPPALKRELLESFFQIPFNRYPSEQPDRLVRQLATVLDLPEEAILAGNGSNELTYTLGLCFIRNERPVVLPRPMFALFSSMTRLFGGREIGIPPRPDLHFDVDAILQAIRTHQPDLTVLASPNNPTGLAMKYDDIQAVCEAAEGFVVADEAYFEFNRERSALDLLPGHPNLIVLRTLSKAFGLAGLRIGYMVAHPDIISEVLKSRLPFMVDRFSESTAMALLRHQPEIRERINQILEQTTLLTEAVAGLDGIEGVIPSSTNFVIFRPKKSADGLAESLADAGVLVRNMGGYPELKGWLRVTAGTPAENKAFLEALESAL